MSDLLQRVIFLEREFDDSDSRRDLLTLFNSREGSELPEFYSARQVKTLIVKNSPACLGGNGHYHLYTNEVYQLIQGHAIFILVDPETKKEDVYRMQRPGDTLYIPARVAHLAEVDPETILVGATDKPYDPQDRDETPYFIK